jgi:hypothetical protein
VNPTGKSGIGASPAAPSSAPLGLAATSAADGFAFTITGFVSTGVTGTDCETCEGRLDCGADGFCATLATGREKLAFPRAAFTPESAGAAATCVNTLEKLEELEELAAVPEPAKFPPPAPFAMGDTASEIGAIPVMDGFPAIVGIARTAPKSESCNCRQQKRPSR